MPRAFDRGVPPLDKNPLQSATSWDDPQGIIGEAANIYGEFLKQWVTTLLEDGLANVFKDCTGGFIEGLRQLGAGETDLAKIGDGLNSFIDTLVATLLCKAEGSVTPQDLLSTVGNIFDLLGASPIIQQLQALVESSGSGLEDALGGAFTVLTSLLGNFTIEDFLMPLLAWIQWLWDQFGSASETFLKPVAEFLHWLWIGAPGGFDGLGEQVDNILKPLIEFATWLWGGVTGGFAGFGATVDTVLKPLIEWLGSIWEQFGDVADTFLTPVIEFLHWLWLGVAGGFTGFGATVDTVLKPAFEFFNWLFGTAFAGAIDTLKNIFIKLMSLVDAGGTLDTWIGQIPLLGPLVSALTQKSPLDGIAMDITTLGNWAKDILTQNTDIPAGKLKGALPPGVLSSIPLSNINFDTPNLLSQGDFGNVGTIEANDGWSWDSAENHSGTGGCAKVTCNGTTRRLYSNQVIKVVAGDRINLSSWVKTSSDFSGGSSSIELILVPFAGTERYTVGGNAVNVYFNQRGSTGNAWAQATGSTVNGTAPWTVPTGVTSVRVRLSVTSAATAGTVWFDDIDLHKTGLLSGDWMNGILGTVAQDMQAAVDQVVKGILGSLPGGATLVAAASNSISGALSTFFSRLFNFANLPTNLTSNPLVSNAIPGLDASKITDGTFGSNRLGENSVDTYQIADDAVETAQIAPDAVTTNEIATNTITSDNINELDGSVIQSGTVNIDYLPTSDLNTVGSGVVCLKSSGSYTTTADTSGTKLPYSFYNGGMTSTADIQILNDGGNVAFKALNEGWYLAEVGFQLRGASDLAKFGYSWNLTPVIFKGLGSVVPYKWGTAGYHICVNNFNGVATPQSWGMGFVSSSWIVKLTANEVIYPGYFWINDASVASDSIIKATSFTGSYGTYFSMSLLNKSLA